MWIALKHFMGWKHLWHRHSEECNSFFWTLTIRGLLPFLTPLLRTENYGLFCWSVELLQTRTPINILFDCRDNLSMNRMKHARCLCRLLNSIDLNTPVDHSNMMVQTPTSTHNVTGYIASCTAHKIHIPDNVFDESIYLFKNKQQFEKFTRWTF